ncbi:MAG: 4-alpha-glucanotransferase [Desulfobulbaceae bacterium]|nr:4-alpha-glucanotransferase [Desulfobulbaceae bacterium]
MRQVISDRSSGILLHVSSLPGSHGVGDIGQSFDFIDFLASAGQSYWQILPLNPTSPIFGNSPYMSFSAFAGNPLFINPDMLHEQGLLNKKDTDGPEFSPYVLEFDRVIPWKRNLLQKAWSRFQAQPDKSDFDAFCNEHDWLLDHALFMALKDKYDNSPWYTWPEEIRCAKKKNLLVAAAAMADEVDYYRFEQYLFFRQWQQLHDHAARKGVRIIGDLPIYVGMDSVDVWANQGIFELDKRTRRPSRVAGVPPDYFSKTGQLWGNPLYRWNTRKATVKNQLYTWWANRFANMFSMVDVLRIDHFRGFESYWSIPGRDKTAENGVWKKGPGVKFFLEMKKRLGALPVIAEDLGYITPEVVALRDKLGYPGMKILLFAFDGASDNAYLPFNYTENCIVYTGTHDNDTAVGWFLDPEVPRSSKLQLKRTANSPNEDIATVHHDIIYLALSSTARLAILPMQDILGFGNDCRMNKPATSGGNWNWRCAPQYLTDQLAASLKDQASFFGRLPSRLDPDAGPVTK